MENMNKDEIKEAEALKAFDRAMEMLNVSKFSESIVKLVCKNNTEEIVFTYAKLHHFATILKDSEGGITVTIKGGKIENEKQSDFFFCLSYLMSLITKNEERLKNAN